MRGHEEVQESRVDQRSLLFYKCSLMPHFQGLFAKNYFRRFIDILLERIVVLLVNTRVNCTFSLLNSSNVYVLVPWVFSSLDRSNVPESYLMCGLPTCCFILEIWFCYVWMVFGLLTLFSCQWTISLGISIICFDCTVMYADKWLIVVNWFTIVKPYLSSMQKSYLKSC